MFFFNSGRGLTGQPRSQVTNHKSCGFSHEKRTLHGHGTRTPDFLLHVFSPNTTGYSRFVECQRHSAKAKKHLANALPSVTLGIQHMALICRQTVVCRVFFIGHSANSLPSVNKHSAKKLTGWNGDVDFAECTTEKHSVKFLKFVECQA